MTSQIPKPVIYLIVTLVVVVIIVVIVKSLKNKKSDIIFPNLPQGWSQDQAVLLRDKLYEYLKNTKVNICTEENDLQELSTCAVPLLAKFLNPTQINECLNDPEKCQSNLDVKLDLTDLALFMVCTKENAKSCNLSDITPPSNNQTTSLKLFV